MLKGWAKFESKQIKERLWDQKVFKFVENDERFGFSRKRQDRRKVSAEGLGDLHYAIKSLDKTASNWILILFRMTEIVIYLTICGKLVLSRKLKINRIFLLDFTK